VRDVLGRIVGRHALEVPEICWATTSFQQGDTTAHDTLEVQLGHGRAASRRLVLSDCAGRRRIAHAEHVFWSSSRLTVDAERPVFGHGPNTRTCCFMLAMVSALQAEAVDTFFFLHVRTLHEEVLHFNLNRAVAKSMNESF